MIQTNIQFYDKYLTLITNTLISLLHHFSILSSLRMSSVHYKRTVAYHHQMQFLSSQQMKVLKEQP